jgi:hypothetical protein
MPQALADLAVSAPTERQIERRRAAIAEAKTLRAEMLERRGGAALSSSWQLIRQAREARTRRV